MLLTVVIPVMNEAGNIPRILDRLRIALAAVSWEVLFVDDGSTDQTWTILQRAAAEDRRVRTIHFSRNFGHQAAVTAGLDFADGDAVVVMDGDLQDPPELVPHMIELFEQGYDVVSPQRCMREGETFFKRWTAKAFYRCMMYLTDKRLTPDVGDFRLFSRRAVIALRSLREQHRFLRGMSAWLGLNEIVITFERKARTEGRTKYSPLKMLRFAWTAISSFSAFPLRLSMAAGCVLSVAGFAYLLYVIYLAIFTHELVHGWASVVALQCAFSGMILFALGIAGDYIARTYEETKVRPLYVVSEMKNVCVPAKLPERTIIIDCPPRNYSPISIPMHYGIEENSDPIDLVEPVRM